MSFGLRVVFVSWRYIFILFVDHVTRLLRQRRLLLVVQCDIQLLLVVVAMSQNTLVTSLGYEIRAECKHVMLYVHVTISESTFIDWWCRADIIAAVPLVRILFFRHFFRSFGEELNIPRLDDKWIHKLLILTTNLAQNVPAARCTLIYFACSREGTSMFVVVSRHNGQQEGLRLEIHSPM